MKIGGMIWMKTGVLTVRYECVVTFSWVIDVLRYIPLNNIDAHMLECASLCVYFFLVRCAPNV